MPGDAGLHHRVGGEIVHAEQFDTRADAEMDAALDEDRAGETDARPEHHFAFGFGGVVDGGLNGFGVDGLAVAGGAVGADIVDGGAELRHHQKQQADLHENSLRILRGARFSGQRGAGRVPGRVPAPQPL